MENPFITYEPADSKIRIGRETDGGYVVVNEGNVYDAFISCGLSDETSFEENFPYEIPSWAFDGTIPERPKNLPKHISFVRKNVGTENTETLTNMHDIIQNYKNIFLKMDIESHEWRWINITDMSPFRQIVIEFHGIWSGHIEEDGPSPSEKIKAAQKLSQTHRLVHVHANNYVPMQHGEAPWVGEFTWIRKDVPVKGLNTTPFPHSGVDFPNDPEKNDYIISYWPFVSKNTHP
jgi:hypothetical protein